eukprot:TRINITY_DN8517_c0_g1_i3.p1 TRINITY_DN8517_c0_g1~~TRINITY_DN8517_c0_g1_i3.p1  ORF type:complete len:203 (-),score=24.62 TRINITY_DN8517_c0_g1_i3:100-708(-)
MDDPFLLRRTMITGNLLTTIDFTTSNSFQQILVSITRLRSRRFPPRYTPEMLPVRLLPQLATETHNFVRLLHRPSRVQTALGNTRNGGELVGSCVKGKSLERENKNSFCSAGCKSRGKNCEVESQRALNGAEEAVAREDCREPDQELDSETAKEIHAVLEGEKLSNAGVWQEDKYTQHKKQASTRGQSQNQILYKEEFYSRG